MSRYQQNNEMALFGEGPPPYQNSGKPGANSGFVTTTNTNNGFVTTENAPAPPPPSGNHASSKKPQVKGGWSVDEAPVGLQEDATPLRLLRDEPRWIYCPRVKSQVPTQIKRSHGLMTWLCCCMICHMAPCLLCMGMNPLTHPQYQDMDHRCSHCSVVLTHRPYDPLNSENIKIYAPNHEPPNDQQPSRIEQPVYSSNPLSNIQAQFAR